MVAFNKSVIVKIIVSALLISMFYITFRLVSKPRKIELDEVKLKDEIKIDKSKTLAVMLQNDEGEYTESESSAFPTIGYRFNSTKSGCIDVKGNIIENALTYNNETNKVNLKINREVKCYTYFDKLYTVTYELNGGEFDVTPPVKEVAYGDTYGELPEPTKEGYTFKGWNGKNKFNEANYLLLSDYKYYNSDSHYSYANIPLKENTTYRISRIRYNGFDGRVGILSINFCSAINCGAYFSVGNQKYPDETGTNNGTFISDNDGLLYIGYVYTSQSSLDTIWANTDVQIEEGTDATEYEPFYIKNDTKVVQRQNHTLKAIWELNE